MQKEQIWDLAQKMLNYEEQTVAFKLLQLLNVKYRFNKQKQKNYINESKGNLKQKEECRLK